MQRLGIRASCHEYHRMENCPDGRGARSARTLSVELPEAGNGRGFLSPSKETAEARRVMAELQVRASGAAADVKDVSGGKQAEDQPRQVALWGRKPKGNPRV